MRGRGERSWKRLALRRNMDGEISPLLTYQRTWVLHRLEDRAKRRGRTPEQEADAILAEAMRRDGGNGWAAVDAVYHRLASTDRTFTDNADLLREDRTVHRFHC